MTDNCDELKDALHAVWSKTRLLLCIFHLMQQGWRWLFDRKHGINHEDRSDDEIQGCLRELRKTTQLLEHLLLNKNDPALQSGVKKFCGRIQQFVDKPSRLGSALHTFGTTSYARKKVTITSLRKKSGKNN